jgi:hypothetical protein
MAPIALGIGLLLLGLFTAVIVCSRVNDPIPPREARDPQAHPRRSDLREDTPGVFEI